MTNFKCYRLEDINASCIDKASSPRNEIFIKIFETMQVKNLGKYNVLHMWNTIYYICEDNCRGRCREGQSVRIVVGRSGVIFVKYDF